LMIIWINIDHKKNTVIIKERKTVNVFVVKNILSQREVHSNEVNVNIENNS